VRKSLSRAAIQYLLAEFIKIGGNFEAAEINSMEHSIFLELTDLLLLKNLS
jgi:hypothetical protein